MNPSCGVGWLDEQQVGIHEFVQWHVLDPFDSGAGTCQVHMQRREVMRHNGQGETGSSAGDSEPLGHATNHRHIRLENADRA